MKKKIIAALLMAMLAIGVVGCGSNSLNWNSGKDAIKVNDEMLKTGYLNSRIKQVFAINKIDEKNPMAESFKAGVIKSTVDLTLLLQYAEKEGLKATDAEVKKLKDELIKSAGSEEKLDKEMEEKGITKDDIPELIKQQVVFNKLQDQMKKKAQVDPQAFYNEHPEQFQIGEQVKASHILVKDEETANKVLKELRDGAKFEDLVNKYSTDEASKKNGGDLGYFTADKMVKEFSDAAFAMGVGTISDKPVKSQFGYHIIKVEDKKPAHTQSFEEVKDRLTESLQQQAVQQEMIQLTQRLNKEAKIEYLLDDYNPEKIQEKAQKEMEEAQKKAQEEAKKSDKDNSKNANDKGDKDTNPSSAKDNK